MNTKLISILQDYFKTKPVDKVWLFGSFSRGEEREDSDIDLIVSMSPDAHMGLTFFGMICDLEDKLHRPVDLVVDGDLLPFAAETANRDKILVYERAA